MIKISPFRSIHSLKLHFSVFCLWQWILLYIFFFLWDIFLFFFHLFVRTMAVCPTEVPSVLNLYSMEIKEHTNSHQTTQRLTARVVLVIWTFSNQYTLKDSSDIHGYTLLLSSTMPCFCGLLHEWVSLVGAGSLRWTEGHHWGKLLRSEEQYKRQSIPCSLTSPWAGVASLLFTL